MKLVAAARTFRPSQSNVQGPRETCSLRRLQSEGQITRKRGAADDPKIVTKKPKVHFET